MAKVARKVATNDEAGFQEYVTRYSAGQATLTADGTYIVVCPKDGFVRSGVLSAGENGADGTDPMNTSLVVTNKRTAGVVFSTAPKLDKTAGTGHKTTAASGTGITVGVVDAAQDDVVAGDVLTVVLDTTQTTPDTAYANVGWVLEIADKQDSDLVAPAE